MLGYETEESEPSLQELVCGYFLALDRANGMSDSQQSPDQLLRDLSWWETCLRRKAGIPLPQFHKSTESSAVDSYPDTHINLYCDENPRQNEIDTLVRAFDKHGYVVFDDAALRAIVSSEYRDGDALGIFYFDDDTIFKYFKEYFKNAAGNEINEKA